MREVKFRAWLPAIKSMTYSHTIEELTSWGNGKGVETKTAEWLQFTGLRDNNGVEIYEGDICEVRIMPCSPDEEEYIARITFEDGCFKFDDGENHLPHLSSLMYEPYTNGYHPCECTVIGNIYEHPHLLQEEA